MAAAASELKRIEHPLRYGWGENRYGESPDDPDGDRHKAARIDVADKCVQDKFWWAMVTVIELAAKLLRDFMSISESCLCHWDLLNTFRNDLAAQHMVKLWLTSPCRGQMGPWLAAGKFIDLMKELPDLSAAEYLVTLPIRLVRGSASASLR